MAFVLTLLGAMLAVALEATTPIRATRVMPIISADAVAAVRPGLRTAFCSAMWPTLPKALRKTMPSM